MDYEYMSCRGGICVGCDRRLPASENYCLRCHLWDDIAAAISETLDRLIEEYSR